MAERSGLSNVPGPAPDADERILSHNLEEMGSPMMKLLAVESIGGNAGFVRIHGRTLSCAAARGLANIRSGEIVAFGDYRKIPRKIRDTCAEFIFRVAVDMKRRPSFFRIVGCSACGPITAAGCKYSPHPFTQKARRILRASVVRWNEEHGVRRRVARKESSSAGSATRR